MLDQEEEISIQEFAKFEAKLKERKSCLCTLCNNTVLKTSADEMFV